MRARAKAGEIWPAVYEKAYAKLKTGTTSDHPDILATAWGDCVWATAQLTGGQREYHDTADNSADKLWDIVRANSLSHRTFNPMTAWTYSSGDAAPKKVVYADANVVASHCYTILGWDYRDGKQVHHPAQSLGQHRSHRTEPRRHRLALRRQLVAPDQPRGGGRNLRGGGVRVQAVLGRPGRREVAKQSSESGKIHIHDIDTAAAG